MTAYINLNNAPIALDSTVKRITRSQRRQFGDGYSQLLTDGLNSQLERWTCTTGPLYEEEVYGIESYLLRQRGKAFPWLAPNSTKSFTAQFEGGELDVGYDNIDTLSIVDQTRPTNYTANLATGLLTSVTIADLTDVEVTLTLEARNYILEDGWQFSFISNKYFSLSFDLQQVYV